MLCDAIACRVKVFGAGLAEVAEAEAVCRLAQLLNASGVAQSDYRGMSDAWGAAAGWTNGVPRGVAFFPKSEVRCVAVDAKSMCCCAVCWFVCLAVLCTLTRTFNMVLHRTQAHSSYNVSLSPCATAGKPAAGASVSVFRLGFAVSCSARPCPSPACLPSSTLKADTSLSTAAPGSERTARWIRTYSAA